MFKIEIEESPILVEVSMETQKIEKERKASYRKIHLSFFIFMLIQVLFYFTFSEPFTALFGIESIIPRPPDEVISRTARLIMIYHSLSVPFVVANTFWILEFYNIRERWIPTLKTLLIPGGYISGTFGMLFAYTRVRIFHEFFYFGLFLVFLGGIVFIVSAFPIPGKFPDPKKDRKGANILGMNWEHVNLIILAVCVLISTLYGAFAALENFTGTIWDLGRPTEAFLPEAIVRHGHHDIVERFIVSHLHIQLAQSTAMVLMVAYRTSKIEGRVYSIVLLFNAIGVMVISYGAWILNHFQIWVGAGLLIICTVLMAQAGFKNVIKDNIGAENYESASRSVKIKAMVSDPVRFAYYFLWVYSQFVVTICGIAVGLQTDDLYRTHGMDILEYTFNVGHWHLLSTVIATLLMIKAIDFYNIQGRSRKIAGWMFFVGSTMAFGFVNVYMLRHLERPPLYDGIALFFTFLGVWILFSAFIFAIFLIARKYRRDNKDKKAANLLLISDQVIQER